MDYTFYLYPGNNISVSVAAKVVVTALAPGEVPPAGAAIIPPPMPPQAPAPLATTAPLASGSEPLLETPPLIIRTSPV